MYKASYKDIKRLLKWGEGDTFIREDLIGKQMPGHIYAYFAPSSANWSWQIGLYSINGKMYELLTKFGTVEGGRQIYSVDMRVS